MSINETDNNKIFIYYGLLCGLWSLGASVLFLNDGISTGGATFDVLPPRSGTLHKHTHKRKQILKVIESCWCILYCLSPAEQFLF